MSVAGGSQCECFRVRSGQYLRAQEKAVLFFLFFFFQLELKYCNLEIRGNPGAWIRVAREANFTQVRPPPFERVFSFVLYQPKLSTPRFQFLPGIAITFT